MSDIFEARTIAHIKSDFPAKFGIPRQSGLLDTLKSKIIFEPQYRTADACRGLLGYSHLWIIWVFSEVKKETWSATVKPPRLGGNTHVGVFATRSPYRPNPIGLSCVKIESIDQNTNLGTVITVSGADLMDGSPILDIKPYIPYADLKPDATGGFSSLVKEYSLEVDFPERWLSLVPKEKRGALIELLSEDPRPSYQNNPDRSYGFGFAGLEIKFKVSDGVLKVYKVEPWQQRTNNRL